MCEGINFECLFSVYSCRRQWADLADLALQAVLESSMLLLGPAVDDSLYGTLYMQTARLFPNYALCFADRLFWNYAGILDASLYMTHLVSHKVHPWNLEDTNTCSLLHLPPSHTCHHFHTLEWYSPKAGHTAAQWTPAHTRRWILLPCSHMSLCCKGY